MVGAGAKILGPITVGAGTRVGANSVVIESTPPDVTVVGIPAQGRAAATAATAASSAASISIII